MFKEQARRLLRTTWNSTQKLSEELFAILSADEPLAHQGTLNLTPNGDQPVIRIVVPGTIPDGFNPIQVVHPDGQGGFNPVAYTPLVPAPDADESGGGVTGGGTTGSGGGALPDPVASGDQLTGDRQGDPPQLPFTTLGRVVSGSGSEYTVDVWLGDPVAGTSSAWGRFPATVLQIDPDEQVPEGTVVYVTCFYQRVGSRLGMTCYFQPPVWLD